MDLTKKEVFNVLPKKTLIKLYNHFRLDINGVHGYNHWVRVVQNGIEISKEMGTSRKQAIIFGFFHDIERYNDDEDPEHGARGADFMLSLKSEINLTEKELESVFLGCEGHNFRKNIKDLEIGACWDADRLDLYRSEIIPDPAYLNSTYTKRKDSIEKAMKRSKEDIPLWAKEVLIELLE